MGKLAWGLLSTGRISGAFAKGLVDSETGELLAVASRSQEKADAFGKEFNVPRCYGSYEEMLADPDVQAVYVSTPHPMHAEWAVKCAEAGKHILCEKPITVNAAEASAVIEAARANDVFLMEAFMYRCNPQTARLVELIQNGEIGEIRMIQATFGFHAGFNPEARLFARSLAGGGILDVGCYPVSFSRLVAGAAAGKPYEEPIEVKGSGQLGASGVDGWAAAVLKFPSGIVAQVATSVELGQDNCARIYGSDGWILVPNAWTVNPAKIVVYRKGRDPEEIEFPESRNIYGIEADTVAANIENRQAPSPAMSWGDTLGNMKVLDAWRAQVGLVYDQEKPDALYPTIDNRPLQVRPNAKMPYGRIAGIDKPVSRLVIGGTAIGGDYTLPRVSVLYDQYFRQGGNCFDTAYIYGNGASEKILGQWIRNRGIRDQVVILDKGAHTPFCDPENLTKQFVESLERLQVDCVDLYIMHRDNEEIPVNEFVDVLNQHKAAGRMKAFGGSNWSIERVEAANAYARSKGLTEFAAVSNNFSLARMVEPVWGGCIAATDPDSRAWFERTRMPLLAWSSLARGFFVRGDENDRSDPGLVIPWYADDNFRRLERTKELAEKKGVEPVVLAMAYVLCQPFPTFPLFGPENVDELRISLKALDVELSPDEMKWLNLED